MTAVGLYALAKVFKQRWNSRPVPAVPGIWKQIGGIAIWTAFSAVTLAVYIQEYHAKLMRF
jgi:hypothetical protein